MNQFNSDPVVAEQPESLSALIADVVEDPNPAFRYCAPNNGMKMSERCELRMQTTAWASINIHYRVPNPNR
jgi:hypothetical protein